jgi:hypothetical protein
MTALARLIPLVALCLIVLQPGAAAQAQSATGPRAPKANDETAAADALFREGLDLMKLGKVAEACAKFSASHRFDPSVGALLNLGNCHEKLSELATAFELFTRAAEQARAEGDDKRASYAEERKTRLEGRLAWLIVEVPEQARVKGLEILREGTPVAERWWNRRAPVHTSAWPGTWTVVARAPGGTPFETRVEVERAGHEVRVRIPVLEGAEPEPVSADGKRKPLAGARLEASASGPVERGEPARPVSPVAGPRDPDSGMSLSRKLALGSAAGGAVAMIGGGVLGWRARGLYLDAKDICDNGDVESCTEDERRRSQAGRDDARSTANLATIAFAVGATAVAAGVILWVVEPGGEHASRSAGKPADQATRIQPVLGPDGIGVQVHGRF